MSIPKFKEKDRIKPIQGKLTSNGVRLKNLIEIEVVTVFHSSYGKRELKVKIIEGSASTAYGNYRKGEFTSIYEDAFELCSPKEPEYDIY